ncbi:MAG: sulfurtransferase TusA family protein [Oceanospirillaceae bacterium]|nr:sulfurtransferase TusA family protein [Oceanospirillaceae bacterium]MCP5351025.1 sulfurtransferase TusA family protein [Oceanospirillaceae bacterium]
MSVDYDLLLDTSGLRCPLPLLKAKQALSSLSPGACLKVIATDAGAWRDIPAFVNMSPHELLAQEQQGEQYWFFIRKGS